MTQEQKDKLEQAAHDHAKQYRSQVSLEGMENISSDFKAGAQTILDNPQEWFPPVQYWQLRDENERLQSELSRYRTALESIAGAEDIGIKVNPLDIALLMKNRAKEALKNNEG